jgi:hypothetical protein
MTGLFWPVRETEPSPARFLPPEAPVGDWDYMPAPELPPPDTGAVRVPPLPHTPSVELALLLIVMRQPAKGVARPQPTWHNQIVLDETHGRPATVTRYAWDPRSYRWKPWQHTF